MSNEIAETGINEENFRAWLAALRSGEFNQGTGTLANKDRTAHCCLGVGCEVAGIAYNPGDPLPPSEFLDWLGVRVDVDDAPGYVTLMVATPGGNRSVAALNDGSAEAETGEEYVKRHSFAEIADIIEATYLGDQ